MKNRITMITFSLSRGRQRHCLLLLLWMIQLAASCLASPPPSSSPPAHRHLKPMATCSTDPPAPPPYRLRNLASPVHQHSRLVKLSEERYSSRSLQESILHGEYEDEESRERLTRGKDVSMKATRLPGDTVERGVWHLTLDEEEFLGHHLEWVVKMEMSQCSLLLVHDFQYRHSRLLHRLLLLPNPRQVVEVGEARDLEGVTWHGKQCRSYMFLLTNHSSLHAFMSQPDDLWDFDGRYMVVGVSREQLHLMAESRKGVKTEHLIGIVKYGWRAGEWAVYGSSLYRGGRGNLRRLYTWDAPSSSSHSVVSQNKLFTDNLKDLHGTPLKVVTFEFEPSVMYYRDASGKVEVPFGIDIEVVSALSRILNFTVIFEEPPKGELWGVKGKDGEWTGMVGQLARGEADMGVANLFLTLTRLGAVEYSAPYDAEVSCFLVRTDPPVPRWLSLVLPFQFSTWGAMLLGVLVTGVFLYAFAMTGDQCGGEAPILRSLPFTCFYALGMHFRESQHLMPRLHNTRVFLCFSWIYIFILTAAYCSNLTAFLTIMHPQQGINTIKALYATRMEISGLGNFFKDALASAVDPYLQGLAERFVPYQELDLVWPRVKDGQAAYLHNKQFLEFVIATQFTGSKGDSSMRIMKECFAPYSIAMALQRNSPLKKKFDRVINWMIASGLVRHWFLESLRLSRKFTNMPRPVAMPTDKHSAIEVMKNFSDMAYAASCRERFERAVKILYGDDFTVKLDLSKRMLFSCLLCRKDMNSEIGLTQHSQSGSHHKNLDQKARELRSTSISRRPDVRYHHSDPSYGDPSSLRTMLAASQVKPVGLQMIEEYQKGPRGRCYYKCTLCGAHGRLDAVYRHIIGHRHTEKYIKSGVVLKNSALTAKEREVIREFLIKKENITISSIKTYRDKSLYPVIWEQYNASLVSSLSKKREAQWASQSTSQSPSANRRDSHCSSPDPLPQGFPPASSSGMCRSDYSHKRERESSPLSKFRNPSPSPSRDKSKPPSVQQGSKPREERQDQSTQKFDLEELMIQLNFIVKTNHLPEFDIRTSDDVRGAIDLMFKISSALHFIVKKQLENPREKSEEFVNNLTSKKNLLSKIMGNIKFRMESALENEGKPASTTSLH